jgi:rhodanese-related sulfurtransferase
VKDKNTNIIVYCSIGVRSEQIGEKLKKLGYKTFITSTAVFLNIKIAEASGQQPNKVTDSVHTFNKTWVY